jgi:hypothetical protein
MCMIPVGAAVILVFLGYVALWTSSRSGTPAGVAQFGKVLSIVMYVIAALTLIGSLMMRHCGRHHGMFAKHESKCCAMMSGQTMSGECQTVKMQGDVPPAKNGTEKGVPSGK